MRLQLIIIGSFAFLIVSALAIFFGTHAPIIAFERDLNTLRSMFRDRFRLSTFVSQTMVAEVNVGDQVNISADQLIFESEKDVAVPAGELGIKWCIMPKLRAIEALRSKKETSCDKYGIWQNIDLFVAGKRHYIGSIKVTSSGVLLLKVVDKTCNSLFKNCPRAGMFDILLTLQKGGNKQATKNGRLFCFRQKILKSTLKEPWTGRNKLWSQK